MNEPSQHSERYRQIEAIVIETVRQIGQELDNPALTHPCHETRLMGDKSGVDSIGLVTLVAEIESRIADAFDVDIVLADERAMSARHSPFRRVSVLIAYIDERLASNRGEPYDHFHS